MLLALSRRSPTLVEACKGKRSEDSQLFGSSFHQFPAGRHVRVPLTVLDQEHNYITSPLTILELIWRMACFKL